MEKYLNNNVAIDIQSVISEPTEGLVQVFVGQSLFDAHRQSTRARMNQEEPQLSWTAQATKDGVGVRIFKFGDITLYNIYDKALGKNKFLMSVADVEKLNVPRYERKNREALPFNASSFLGEANLATA